MKVGDYVFGTPKNPANRQCIIGYVVALTHNTVRINDPISCQLASERRYNAYWPIMAYDWEVLKEGNDNATE